MRIVSLGAYITYATGFETKMTQSDADAQSTWAAWILAAHSAGPV